MKKKLTDILYSFSLLLFIIAFNFQHNPPEGWYQQFLPPINNRPISDITFIDSLTGFAVTPYTANDTAYILKTDDGGDTWNIVFQGPTNVIGGFSKVQFLNLNTGYACRNFLWKTTDGGLNWNQQNTSGIFPENMYVLNEDTIWLIDSEGFTGGVFRTTNGGASWTQQVNLGGQNPSRIYMYDAMMGFITNNTGTYLRRTTNSGQNWEVIPGEIGYRDIKFIDSHTGWKGGYIDSIKYTTDRGTTWNKQLLPPTGGFFSLSVIDEFSIINPDTLWGVGARGFTSLGFRGLIYISTDKGETWGYQLPDTNNINIGRYSYIDFIDKLNGWAYGVSSGVHTVTGGDTTYYITSVNQVGNEIPSDYILHQNFPNPFNPSTKITYELKSGGMIKLKVFDIRGKEVSNPVKENQQSGVYELNFSASEYGMVLSSGIYFYSLYIDDRIVDTKKMLLVK